MRRILFWAGKSALVVAGGLCMHACSPGSGTTGSVAVALAPPAASIPQGHSDTVTARLTRSGFAGNVDVTVEGAPQGVSASVIVPVGSGDSAQIVISVGLAAPIGTYQLVIHARPSDGSDATATLLLTIVTPPSYLLIVTNSVMLIGQGASGFGVALVYRTAFTGPVTLSADSLPAGVSASFTSPITADSTSFALDVAWTAAPGTYTVLIRGSANGLPDVTTPVTLTITAVAPFTAVVSPATITVSPGGFGTASLSVTRAPGFNGFIGFVVGFFQPGFTVSMVPAGGTFSTIGVAANPTFSLGPTYPIPIDITAPGVTSLRVVLQVTIGN